MQVLGREFVASSMKESSKGKKKTKKTLSCCLGFFTLPRRYSLPPATHTPSCRVRVHVSLTTPPCHTRALAIGAARSLAECPTSRLPGRHARGASWRTPAARDDCILYVLYYRRGTLHAITLLVLRSSWLHDTRPEAVAQRPQLDVYVVLVSGARRTSRTRSPAVHKSQKSKHVSIFYASMNRKCRRSVRGEN